MSAAYPFAAIVGADDLARALLLNAVHPAIGGVLVRGEKGTAKSTAVRGLAALLPCIDVVEGCAYACDPATPDPGCPAGPHEPTGGTPARRIPVPLVELPVGASEDRLAGSLDLERALVEGHRAFEPGLLAAAHRALLYVDEVNLLGDHLVDLLLDAAAMGVNIVEREGVSVRHPARFQLVGTMNPEEGELRPQLLDRFGITVEVRATRDPAERTEVVRRRLAYEADPDGFAAGWAQADAAIAARIERARRQLPFVTLPDTALRGIVAACAAAEVDGLRADIVTAKTASALAAWDDRAEVTLEDVRVAARLALTHRRRRTPFEEPGSGDDALEQAIDEALEGVAGQPPQEQRDSGPPADGPPPAPAEPPARPGAAGDPAPPGPAEAVEGPAEAAPAAPQPLGADPHRSAPSEAGEPSGSPTQGQPLGTAAPLTLPVGALFTPRLFTAVGGGGGVRGRRSPAEGRHGRHVADRRPLGRLTDVALGATLRAAAPEQRRRARTGVGLALRTEDLREKIREGREGNLVLFVVDASGSMAARQRMTAVKGAVLSLLVDAYQRRDRVGLIAFRGETAEVVLPPTGSVERAAHALEGLPTGGRTPLAAGLIRAAALLAAERVRDPRRRPLLVLLTDGRATAGTDPLAAAERAAAGIAAGGTSAVVVDTEDGRTRLGLAGRLARALGAPWVRLEELAAGSLAGVVRACTPQPATAHAAPSGRTAWTP